MAEKLQPKNLPKLKPETIEALGRADERTLLDKAIKMSVKIADMEADIRTLEGLLATSPADQEARRLAAKLKGEITTLEEAVSVVLEARSKKLNLAPPEDDESLSAQN